MELDTREPEWVLRGTRDEFAEAIGLLDYPDVDTLKDALREISGVTVEFGPHTWTLRGEADEFAEMIGLPDYGNLSEVKKAYRNLWGARVH